MAYKGIWEWLKETGREEGLPPETKPPAPGKTIVEPAPAPQPSGSGQRKAVARSATYQIALQVERPAGCSSGLSSGEAHGPGQPGSPGVGSVMQPQGSRPGTPKDGKPVEIDEYISDTFEVSLPESEQCTLVHYELRNLVLKFTCRVDEEHVVGPGDPSLEGPNPPTGNAKVCLGHNVIRLKYTYTPPAPKGCKGWYQVTLTVEGVGDTGQMRRARPSGDEVHVEKDITGRKESRKDIGQPEMIQKDESTFVFVWPRQQRDCGTYTVEANLEGKLKTDLPPLNPAPPYRDTVEVQNNVVRYVDFKATVDLSGGGGQPPEKPKPGAEEQPAPGEGAGEPWFAGASAAEETAAAEYGAGFPAFGGDAIARDLERRGVADVDPMSALVARPEPPSRSLPYDAGLAAVQGPPWTQLDIIIDPNASQDARDAVNLHDIQGQRIVRGHFDGRFRGFIAGPM